MLRDCATANPMGTVLFSTTQAAHLRENLQVPASPA
jgi:hypothetical protein